ncbi:hypothetical protein RUND412_004406 [Rhizina undulata]
MPTIPITTLPPLPTPSPLPQLLQTPSGLALLEIQGTLHIPSLPSTLTSPLASLAFGPQSSVSVLGGEEERGEEVEEVGEEVEEVGEEERSGEGKTNVLIGTLHFDSATSKVHLYVGPHQRLTGVLKKLNPPLGVLRNTEGKGESLEIVEIVRWKVLFGQRPEPV